MKTFTGTVSLLLLCLFNSFNNNLSEYFHGGNWINYRITCRGIPNSNRPAFHDNIIPVQFDNSTNDGLNMSFSMCKKSCFQEVDCKSLAFKYKALNNSLGDCYLNAPYPNTSYILDQDVYLNISLCNMSSEQVCMKCPNNNCDKDMGLQAHRCPGMWMEYTGYMINWNISRPAIRQENYISLAEAQMRCLLTLYCSGFTKVVVNASSTFYFYRDWPIPLSSILVSYHHSFNTTANTYIWKCGNCTERKDSEWKEDPNVKPPQNSKYYASFFTVSSYGCREECKLQKQYYPHKKSSRSCTTAYYNKYTYLCLLESNITSDANKKHCPLIYNTNKLTEGKNMTKYTFIKKGPSDLRYDIGESDEEVNNTCVYFRHKTTSFADKCNYPDFLQNSSLKGVYLFKSNEHPVTIGKKEYTKFNRGYEDIWIQLDSKSNYVPINDHFYCQLYSGAVYRTYLQRNTTVISRVKWGAAHPSRWWPQKLPSRIRNVIVKTSKWPTCGCLRWEHCSEALRALQTFSTERFNLEDIPDSFYASDFGGIYEGRGWTEQPDISSPYYEDSITISFIGLFNGDSHPTMFALNAVKHFLEESLKREKLAPDYNLVFITDISPDPNKYPDSEKIKSIVSNWPHYKGQQKKQWFCKSALIVAIVLSLSIAISLTFVIVGSLYCAGIIHRSSCNTSRGQIYHHLDNSSRIYLSAINFNRGNSPNQNEEQLIDIPDHVHQIAPNQWPINLNFLNVSLIYQPSHKCCCPISTNQLYRHIVSTNNSDLIESLRKSYFLKKCDLTTYLLLLEPQSHLEKSLLLIIHVKNAALLLFSLFNHQMCFCRKMILESASHSPLLLTPSSQEDISEDSSVWREKSVKSFWEEVVERNTRLIINGEEVIFKYIQPRILK